MHRRMTTALAAMLALLLCFPAAAQWKWRDSRGQIQYSDLPPPANTPQQDILQKPVAQRQAAPAPAAAASAASAPQPKAVEPELEARKREAEKQQLAQRKVEEDRQAAVRADNCQQARAQMRQFDSGQRIARVNEKGEREILDDAARAEGQRRARDAIASECR